MVKYHLENKLTLFVQQADRYKDLTEEEHIRLYDEIKNAVLQGIDDKLYNLSSQDHKVQNDNKVQSLLLWILGLTDVKPTEKQVIKNPGSYCDIDSDFEQGLRENLINYIKETYTTARVCQIATFGTMGAKGSVRNAARALGYSIVVGENITKFISEEPGATIQSSIDNNKDFRDHIAKLPEAKKVVEIALKLEGLPNSVGCHASALCIADTKLTDYFPLMSANRKDSSSVISQWDMKDVESQGILKFDELGLQTLDDIHETVNIIKQKHGIDIDVYNLDFNDPKIYKLLHSGFNAGIFQFTETAGGYLPKILPQNIDEISALTSILRPGPLKMGMVDRYVEAKFDNMKFSYDLTDKALLEKVWEICSESYGLLIYQEQVIKCFAEIAGFDEIEGDNARRAMGKKKPEEMAALKEGFVEGGVKKGYEAVNLSVLFDQIEGFSGYGFNKSHAVAYSINTCITAWLSTYYPLEFHAALLSVHSSNTDDVRTFVAAIKSRGFKICAPDINKSEANFIITDDAIVFGLMAVKGVGASVTKKIMSRKGKNGYRSFGHFIKRNVDILNSRILEFYTKAGCFASFGYNKETILQNIPYILELMSIIKGINKHTIFDIKGISLEDYIEDCIISKINQDDLLQYEIDSLGLYITDHPMDGHMVNDLIAAPISDIDKFSDGSNFNTVGAISGISIRKTKAKMNMCSFNLTTSLESVECIMFPKQYGAYISSGKDVIKEGALVFLKGRVKEEANGKSIIVNEITDNVSKALCKITKKKDKTVIFKRLNDLTTADFCSNILNIEIKPYLKFILEKI